MPRRPAKAHLSQLPAVIAPELATLVDQAPEGEGWLHEIKLDGYRTAARIEGGKVRLLTRTGLDWTARLRPIATALASLPIKGAYRPRKGSLFSVALIASLRSQCSSPYPGFLAHALTTPTQAANDFAAIRSASSRAASVSRSPISFSSALGMCGTRVTNRS